MAPKVLFLHGWCSDGSSKSMFIRLLGYKVFTPKLSNWFFSKAVRTAQEAYDNYKPDVIVGSSRGGAVAINIESGDTPLVLIAPAWRRFGKIEAVKAKTVILHSEVDDMVPYADSQKLVNKSVKGVRMVTVGDDHRLNCPESRMALREALALFATPLPDPVTKSIQMGVLPQRLGNNSVGLYLSDSRPSTP
jgi:hypothetical protein